MPNRAKAALLFYFIRERLQCGEITIRVQDKTLRRGLLRCIRVTLSWYCNLQNRVYIRGREHNSQRYLYNCHIRMWLVHCMRQNTARTDHNLHEFISPRHLGHWTLRRMRLACDYTRAYSAKNAPHSYAYMNVWQQAC